MYAPFFLSSSSYLGSCASTPGQGVWKAWGFGKFLHQSSTRLQKCKRLREWRVQCLKHCWSSPTRPGADLADVQQVWNIQTSAGHQGFFFSSRIRRIVAYDCIKQERKKAFHRPNGEWRRTNGVPLNREETATSGHSQKGRRQFCHKNNWKFGSWTHQHKFRLTKENELLQHHSTHKCTVRWCQMAKITTGRQQQVGLQTKRQQWGKE